MRVNNDSFAPRAATRASLLAVGHGLLKLRDKDTIKLTNGCTISGDQFYAIGDTLDRCPRPNHEIVEATGMSILCYP
jgi:G3E family GTPase